MAAKRRTDAACRKLLAALKECGGNQGAAGRMLGMPEATFVSALRDAKTRFPDLYTPPAGGKPLKLDVPDDAPVADRLKARLMKSPATLDHLRAVTGLGEKATLGLIEDLRATGFNIRQLGDTWMIDKHAALPAPIGEDHSQLRTLVSRPDNTFLIGASGDQHLCSSYCRLDVLNDLYDNFAAEGVQVVYNTGNWIDGEASFNKHELIAHGMDNQLRYLAEHFPQRKGIETHAVAGDDHEGWYQKFHGVDIGKYAETKMREAGRTDWLHLGYMEANIKLVNANSGAYSILSVVHPGGGSAYAVSYSIQKIIEVLDGGEKPAVGLYGHYHKLWCGNIRNVWVQQTGTCQDQTSFMRKKKIDAHVGGAIIKMMQDPRTGAIIRFKPDMMRYFNKGYYDGRWNPGGAVVHPVRAP